MRFPVVITTIVLCVFTLVSVVCQAQVGRQSVFAHNDYLKPRPFHEAYSERVGFIEVDVFLRGSDLLVAHTRAEIKPGTTIEGMYLRPLQEQVRSNNGHAYPDSSLVLHLMVDIKTDALPTLKRLVEILSLYPELTMCKGLIITISGNMPAPTDWLWIPAYIHFDGRLGVSYNEEQLTRVPLVSASFRNFSSWKGNGTLPAKDRAQLVEAIMAIHEIGKPARFWGSPDHPEAWRVLTALGIDIINTDKINDAVRFVDH